MKVEMQKRDWIFIGDCLEFIKCMVDTGAYGDDDIDMNHVEDLIRRIDFFYAKGE